MKILNLSEIKKIFAVGVTLATAIFLFFQPIAACSWDYLIWENRSENSEPYYRFLKGGNAGFIDRTGKIVIEPTLRNMGNGQSGVINGLLEVDYDKFTDVKSGKEVSKEFYERNTAIVKDLNLKVFGYRYGYVDDKGRTVLEPIYFHAQEFSEGLAAVVLEGPCLYNSGGPCSGFDTSQESGPEKNMPACRFNFIDKNGKPISKQTFLDAEKFSQGLAPVKTEQGWGYINRNGKFVIAPQFEKAFSHSEGLALVKYQGLYGYINLSGSFTIAPQFKDAQNFSNGLAAVGAYSAKTAASKFYYINKNGKPITDDKFLLAGDYFKGVAHVLVSETLRSGKKGDRELEMRTRTFAYLDVNGKKIFVYKVEEEM